ncbi:hypothetical protein EV424DRAFT_1345847 [Suillus variegatus]|nr:hypothetical protein EV424DRAFT_1345847 [Suillus variegatus]
MAENTTKKRAAGGVARRLTGPLGLPVASPPPVSPEGEAGVVQPDTHSSWCLICRDGAEGDIVLYECSACPRVMCSRCLDVPSASHDLVTQPEFFFGALAVMLGTPLRHPHRTIENLPAQGGKPALQGFLQLNGRFETGSCAVLAAAPIAVIHFIVGGSNEVVTPVSLLSHYLEHYFPNGRYIYIEVPFDITTHKSIRGYTRAQDTHIIQLKTHLAHSGRVLAFFSDHSEEDSGWLFAGKDKGKFVAMSVSQVLSSVLGPYYGILSGATMIFLVCGSVVAHDDAFSELQEALLDYGVASAIIFTAKRFQPLVATNFLLALAEQVVIEQLNVHIAFPSLLSLSSPLGQHTNVILMTRHDAGGTPKLLVTNFARAHTQTQPWGIAVPSQCPLCGSTNSWSEKVAVKVSYESLDPGVPDEAPVYRYLYSCTYPDCGKAQRKPCHKFHIEKPPGSILKAAKTKSSGWFQSPSTTFPALPFIESGTQGKHPRSSDGEVTAKRMRV